MQPKKWPLDGAIGLLSISRPHWEQQTTAEWSCTPCISACLCVCVCVRMCACVCVCVRMGTQTVLVCLSSLWPHMGLRVPVKMGTSNLIHWLLMLHSTSKRKDTHTRSCSIFHVVHADSVTVYQDTRLKQRSLMWLATPVLLLQG